MTWVREAQWLNPSPVRRTRSPCREQDTLPYAQCTLPRLASMRKVHVMDSMSCRFSYLNE